MTALGVPPAQIEPKATEHIPQILALIRRLEELGFAYGRQGGDVFFRVRRFPGYGKLSGQKVEDMESGARIEVDPNKEDPLDFVLWKASKPGEPAWDSPWGPGRPGWHIECSAMSMMYLGEQLDIHCGGADHVDIHHTNEIAQSEAATGRKFFNVWMHGAFLNIQGGKKMAKSEENFLTLDNALIKRGIPPLAYRYAAFQTHYRKPMEYTDESIQAAKNGLEHLFNQVREVAKGGEAPGEMMDEADEELIEKAIEVIVRDRRPTTSYVQRCLRIGYNRAARIIEKMEQEGIVGPSDGSSKPREVFINKL